MPKSALPEGFDNSQKGDWNFWPFRYLKPSLTAFGPRCTERWAKWREFPIRLFFRGKGAVRWENTDGSVTGIGTATQYTVVGNFKAGQLYISAIQYWCKWHVQIQWPLFFAAHYYLDELPVFPARAGERRVLSVRIGARRNADGFYDFPSAYIGIHFN